MIELNVIETVMDCDRRTDQVDHDGRKYLSVVVNVCTQWANDLIHDLPMEDVDERAVTIVVCEFVPRTL